MPHNDSDPQYWLELAEDDEKSARILVREGAAPDIAAYHFHQAAEKYLKGWIAAKGGDIPRVHDLERLFKLAELLGVRVSQTDFDELSLIQSYYSELRYPRGDRLEHSDLDRIIEAFELLRFKVE